MRKLLLITDQEEYSENGTISTLFDRYLREHWDVDIVYITPYKFSYQKRDNHHIVPIKFQSTIMNYLDTGIDVYQYDFVMVRNQQDVLINVLENKDKFGYKVGYRIPYPTQHYNIKKLKSFSPIAFLTSLKYKNKIKQRDILANECDLFLPASVEAHEAFYPDINTRSFPIFIGLDPDTLNKHKVSDSSTVNLVNVGTIDTLRQFDVILDALDRVEFEDWHLNIIASNTKFINGLLSQYPKFEGKVTIHESIFGLEGLRELINKNDVGIAMLPRSKFHDTVIANKIIHYASCGLPALMTTTQKNHSIFEEDEAFFSDFDADSIAKELEVIMNMSKDKIVEIGEKGQSKLLELKRNYKKLAQELAEELDSILDA
jgi:hypothetical protein